LSASNAENPALLAQFIEEVQRRGVRKYIDSRLAQVINNCVSDCDVVAYRDDRFFVICPELARDKTEAVSRRLREAARRELGLALNIGSATFPEEEVTLGGLLERAEDASRGKLATPATKPQSVPSPHSEASLSVNVNVSPSSS
jgi:hypothetical protein